MCSTLGDWNRRSGGKYERDAVVKLEDSAGDLGGCLFGEDRADLKVSTRGEGRYPVPNRR